MSLTATAPSTAAPAAPAAPAAGSIKKVSLDGFQKSAPAAKKKTEYPLLPESEEVKALVDSILQRTAHVEALDLEKKELTAMVRPFYFEHYHGKGAIASSVRCVGSNGQEVLVAMQNRYTPTTNEAALTALAGEHLSRLFVQSFGLKIDGEKIPDAAIEPLLGELQELFAKHHASEALTAFSALKPKKDYHTLRHTLFNVGTNMELERVLPIVAQVKTKGRGNTDDE